VAVNTGRRQDPELIAKEMNLMPPLPQAFSRAIENPFGSPSKIEPFMR
jgi:hypothetical protein